MLHLPKQQCPKAWIAALRNHGQLYFSRLTKTDIEVFLTQFMLDIQDILEFLADVHTLSKVKSNVKGLTVGLNEDTLGGILKSSLAQFVALEITKGNGRENRSANRFLPWLFNPPANTAAQVGEASMICQ